MANEKQILIFGSDKDIQLMKQCNQSESGKIQGFGQVSQNSL